MKNLENVFAHISQPYDKITATFARGANDVDSDMQVNIFILVFI